jgi:hypothetical protein
LRVLDYVSKAGTLKCPVEWNSCVNGVYHQSCCGDGDAYEADDFRLDGDGRFIAILTCNDPADCEEIPGKVIRAAGTEFAVPPSKVLVNYDPSNNTGHGWIWVSPYSKDESGNPIVFCFSEPSGG